MNKISVKQQALKLVKSLPDNCTWEDVQYHIYVREKIERGLKDVREGRVLTQKEAEQRMAKWLGK